VPKIPSYKITDVAEAIGPECRTEVIGIRPGEKLHEEMITASDSFSTYDLGDRFVILPQVNYCWKMEDYLDRFEAKKVTPGFFYTSDTNTQWLSVKELRSLIRLHVDPSFELE
jgi:FlaA1/EpsC-like NDP-sugar epimerase